MATDDTTITVMMAGCSSGRMIEKKSRNGDTPSIMAASSISLGMDAMNARKIRVEKGMVNATSTMISPKSVLYRPTHWSRKIVGTTAGGMMSPASMTELTIDA